MEAETQKQLADLKQFAEDLRGESDRAAAVLGGAKLDLMLKEIIRKFLIPIDGAREELLENDGPLGTFSARTKMVYRLGLLQRDFVRALDLVRKIRNDFAHEVSGVQFDASPHRDRVTTLASMFDKRGDVIKEAMDWHFSGMSEASAEFRAIVSYMSLRLAVLSSSLKGVPAKYAFSLLG